MSLQTFFDNFTLLTDAPNGVAKLRELVLKLAVEGKLVSQESDDEPASIILEKVSQEKKRLIKEGELNNKKSLPEINDDERCFKLPENWVWIRMGNIVDQRLGKMLDKGKNKGKLYPYLRNTNVQWLRFDLSDVKEMRFEDNEIEEYEVRPGDLLVCEGGEPGRCAIWDGQIEQIMFQKAIHRLRPFAGIHSWFLLYRLLADAMTGYLEKHFTGATIKHFTGQELSKYVIGLPPLEEQKRIVGKVDELMRLCDELEARQQDRRESRVRLNNATLAPLNDTASLAPEEFERASVRLANNFTTLYDAAENVGKLRSTILQLAVQGKLVPQDPHDEPASVLLKGIRKERDRLIKEKKIKQDKPLPPLAEDDVLFELPDGWEWSRLDSLCYLITDGTHYTPTYVPSGVPFLSVKDVTGGKIDFCNTRFISPKEHAELSKRCKPEFQDILFTKVGTTGIARVVDVEMEFSIFVSLALLKFSKNYLSPYFLELLLNSPLVRDQSERNTQGVGNKNLVLKSIRNFVVPLPPLEEQKRIVAKVNQLIALCDELKARLRQTEADGEHLMKAAVRHLLDSVKVEQAANSGQEKSQRESALALSSN